MSTYRDVERLKIASLDSVGPRFIDETGNFYGWLFVIGPKGSEMKSGSRCWYYWCECVRCGKIKPIMAKLLRRGTTISCGCSGGANLHPGEAALNHFYDRARRKAGERNIPFRISKKVYSQLIKEKCFYCGEEPSESFSYRGESFLLNTVDRFDNDKSYTRDNCVPACDPCNKGKWIQNPYEFIDRVRRIHEKKKRSHR